MTQLALIHHHGNVLPYWDDTKNLDGEIIDFDESHASLESLVTYCDRQDGRIARHDWSM